MDRGVDIAVYSRDGRLQLVVEAKSQQQTSPEWAARFRRNLLAHQAIPPSNYFLLAMPDHLYLWKDGVNLTEAPPNYEISTWEVLGDYLGARTGQLRRFGEESLQLALASWLNDVASSKRELHPESEVDRMLIDSGLYEAIKSGTGRVRPMIVYVESNSVLELAFLQEEHQSASKILEYAESRRINLLMPAFCGPSLTRGWFGAPKTGRRFRADFHGKSANSLGRSHMLMSEIYRNLSRAS